MFDWSEVHLYRSNFLQNPYFNITTLFLTEIYLSHTFFSIPINKSYCLCKENLPGENISIMGMKDKVLFLKPQHVGSSRQCNNVIAA